MSKKFLIIQLRAEDEAADNEFEAFCTVGGILPEEVERIRAEKAGIPEFNVDDYAAIIVGGSPFDISTPEDVKSDIQKKVETDFTRLLSKVIKKDIPFLGACSGNGLVGNFCGGTISKKYGELVGGVDVTVTEEGKKDPLLRGLPNTFRALVGHKEACETTPPGAVLLARSTTCPVQMFRVGKNVYATQFHPEADADVFIVRIHVYKNYGYFPPEEADALIERIQQEDVPVPKKILRRFIDQYRV
ncbi:glutamine amidotransferase [Candidatus Kaiserbacteria bacterium]|nr:glutamine amidotransferase [Candidatus Kaiserbacteria bacterium]